VILKNNWKETIQILKRKGYSIKEICDFYIISPFSEEEIKNILNRKHAIYLNTKTDIGYWG